MPGIRIEGGLIVTMDPHDSILPSGTIVVREGRIASVGTGTASSPSAEGETVIDARDRIVMPGLVNAHMHQRPMRGIGDGHALKTWHDVYVDAVSDRMSGEDAYAGGLLGFGEALKAGITTVMADTIHPQAEARAAVDIGIRARLFAHIIHEEEAERYFDLLRRQGGSEEDRVRFWVGLEVAAACSSSVRRRARRMADELRLRLHTHFSEARRQSVEDLIEDGFLGPDLHLAHCVHVTPEDIDQLARYGVKVAHCPTSNLKLASGIAPIPAMRAKGIPVGISTDAILSNGRLDLFEQMRVAALMQRGLSRDPGLLPVQDLLQMTTREAARVMGLEKEVGSLEAGKRADITILRTDRLELTPLVHQDGVSNLLELLVWSAAPADVDTVIADGQIVVQEGELKSLSEEEIRRRVQSIGRRILSDAGLPRQPPRPVRFTRR